MANSSVGQSLLTTVASPSVTVVADSATINLTKRTRTTATGQFGADQAVPIVLPVATQSAAGLMSAADKVNLDTMEWSSINLIDGSESVTVAAGDKPNAYIAISINELVNVGDELAVSIANISVLEGNTEKLRVAIYDDKISSIFGSCDGLTIDNKSCVIKITSNANNSKAKFLLYAGLVGNTSGNTVKYDKIMLVRGNKPCPSWFPSYNDIKALLTPTTTTLVLADASTDVMTLDETGATSEAVKRIVVRPGDEVFVPAGEYDVVAVGLDTSTANPAFPMDASITIPAEYASMLTWVGVENIASIYRSPLAESAAASLQPGDMLRLNIHFQPTTVDGENYNVFIDAVPFSKIE